jgi:hypothetical protein
MMGFFLAAVALLFASFAYLRLLTIPLSGLGLVVSLVGVLATPSPLAKKDFGWLSAGAGVSILVLVLGLFLPSWLSDQWAMDFAVPEPDLNQQFLVTPDNKQVVKQLTEDDWADTGQYAVRQGDILVRVESAVVDHLPTGDEPALLITLRLANVGQLHSVMYHGQADGQYVPIVRDSRGKDLARRDLGGEARQAGQVRTVTLYPGREVKDLLVFVVPWPGTGYVKLEIPAAAWGRNGVCKLQIPRSSIIYKHSSNGEAP